MSAWIRGMGVVGGFGCGRAALEAALASGSAVPQSLAVPTGQGIVELPAYRADTGPLDNYVPKRALRRMDGFARMALLGACLALEDAGLSPGGLHTGLILASGQGATGSTLGLLDSFFEAGDACASPIHFANSLHNAAAAHLSILLGADGPCVTLSHGRLSLVAALLTAQLWLEEGRAAQVLVGCVEELSEVMGYAWLKTHGSSLTPGEGAAFFLLAKVPEGATLELSRVVLGEGLDADLPAAPSFPQVYGHGPAAVGFDVAAASILLGARGLPGIRVLVEDPEGGCGGVSLKKR